MIVRIPETTLFTDLGGEAVLLNLESGTYYSLDEVGTRMWNLLAADGRPESVVAALLAEYDVAEDRLREDLEALVADLARAGLVLADPPRPPP